MSADHNSNPDPQRQYLPAARKLYNEAKSKGMWLYDPQYHRWYSPEDFLQSFGNAFSDLSQFFERVQIRDPQDGISAANQKIRQLQEKLEIFTKRVLKYFRKG